MAKRGPKVNLHTPEYHSRIAGFLAKLQGDLPVKASKATAKPKPAAKPVAKAKAPTKKASKPAHRPAVKNDLVDTEAGEAMAALTQQ